MKLYLSQGQSKFRRHPNTGEGREPFRPDLTHMNSLIFRNSKESAVQTFLSMALTMSEPIQVYDDCKNIHNYKK